MKATCTHKHWGSIIPKDKSSCVCVCLQTERKTNTEGCWGKRMASLSYVMWSMSQKPERKTNQCHSSNDSGDSRNDTVKIGLDTSFGEPMRKGAKNCHSSLVSPSQWISNNLSILSEGPQTSVHVDYHLLSKTLLTGRVFNFRYVCILNNLYLHETSWEWVSSLKEIHLFNIQLCTLPEIISYNIFSVPDFEFNFYMESGIGVSNYALMKVFRMC